MEPTLKLKQAVADYKSGKCEAFTALYEESKRYVYICIYKVMSGSNNVQEAIQDIMQETYLEISRHIAQLKEDDKFLLWAGTIANRKCIAYLKQNEKYVLLDEDDTTIDTLADKDEIIPEEIIQNKEKQRLLMEIIDTKLTRAQKICVLAYYCNQIKQSEIAKELGIPENTVKTNLSRAKVKIQEGVLDLEKNKDTKLYSVAPFLLFLLDEEVKACVVPQFMTQGVMDIVMSNISKEVATKGTVGLSSISLKLKLITVLVFTLLIGAVVGVVGVITQNDDMESTYVASDGIYEEDDVYENTKVNEETKESEEMQGNRLWDILLNPTKNSDYYPYGNNAYRVWYSIHTISLGNINYMDKVSELWFATVDINGDGVSEVLVGTCSNESTFTAILNVLQYDAVTGQVSDLDGNRVYEACGSGQCLYETGILKTWETGDISYTYYWSLPISGSWQCIDVAATESESAYMQIRLEDDSVVSGAEADKLVDSLNQGNTIPIVWHRVTEENLEKYLKFE